MSEQRRQAWLHFEAGENVSLGIWAHRMPGGTFIRVWTDFDNIEGEDIPDALRKMADHFEKQLRLARLEAAADNEEGE